MKYFISTTINKDNNNKYNINKVIDALFGKFTGIIIGKFIGIIIGRFIGII